MIRVAKVKKPTAFDEKVKKPGDAWLKANPDAKRPRTLWEPYTATLSMAYGDRCGYAAMLDPTGGSVDHYLSFKNHRSLAYEWSNYRFASNTLNSSKRNADDTVLDPQEVKPGWFKILLPSLQMVVTDAVPKSHKAKAEFTLKRLKLRDGERIIRWRRSWYCMYQAGDLSLAGLRDVAPLIAEAVDAQAVVAR
ncbi:MAG: hypothetical protein Q8K38_12775 [Burkholderiaceae bacterium]|nr:hypothetical protein [Burkholderiaceae bacterium]